MLSFLYQPYFKILHWKKNVCYLLSWIAQLDTLVPWYVSCHLVVRNEETCTIFHLINLKKLVQWLGNCLLFNTQEELIKSVNCSLYSTWSSELCKPFDETLKLCTENNLFFSPVSFSRTKKCHHIAINSRAILTSHHEQTEFNWAKSKVDAVSALCTKDIWQHRHCLSLYCMVS